MASKTIALGGASGPRRNSMPGLRPPRVTVIKVLLQLLNVASTVLTLFSGLRENPVIVTLTGRYDSIRSRMQDGSINLDNARSEVVKLDMLAPLGEIAHDYRFITAPRRDPSSIGEERTTCTNVNSINTTVMGLLYDDFWGKGARRVQIFVYSISAPNCRVVNFKPTWYANCVATREGNATACHDFILGNFDTLLDDQRTQIGAELDFGKPGIPFLKCRGRPSRVFEYQTDLLTHQSYWAGGSYHVQIQTSNCRALPRVRSADDKWTLFQTEAQDKGADVLLALPNTGWLAKAITALYSVVSITLIAAGIMAAVIRTRRVRYLPNDTRYSDEHRLARYVLPFMPIATELTECHTSVITFKGELLVAADVWINHWLYMSLSILDAVSNIRLTYVTLQVGTWMLIMKITFDNFVFLCSALTKITWIMCLVHTIVRLLLKVLVRFFRSMRLIQNSQRVRLEALIDGASMFLSYKVYNILLCVILGLMLQFLGQPTFMRRQSPYKVGMFGGIPRITRFWQSELVCDLLMLLSIQLVCDLCIGLGLMRSRYRFIARNGVMRLLQHRYFFVGWDAIMAAEMLGMDPSDPHSVSHRESDDEIARTKCTIGALLQLLYQSGPSSFVHLAGDYLFTGQGFGKDPMVFRYPVKKAVAMGLCKPHGFTSGLSVALDKSSVVTGTRRGSGVIQRHAGVHPTTSCVSSIHDDGHGGTEKTISATKSLFDRRLEIVSEGYLGKVLLVDELEGGSLSINDETGMREYVVRDALGLMSIVDIRPLISGDRQLCIR